MEPSVGHVVGGSTGRSWYQCSSSDDNFALWSNELVQIERQSTKADLVSQMGGDHPSIQTSTHAVTNLMIQMHGEGRLHIRASNARNRE